jgi:hypothetical protein
MPDSFIQPSRPDEQPLDRLTGLLLISTGVISTMCNGLLTFARSGCAEEGFDVQRTAEQLIREALDEIGARHSEEELAVVATVIEESLNAICDGLLDGELDHPACEGRRHGPRLSARWR